MSHSDLSQEPAIRCDSALRSGADVMACNQLSGEIWGARYKEHNLPVGFRGYFEEGEVTGYLSSEANKERQGWWKEGTVTILFYGWLGGLSSQMTLPMTISGQAMQGGPTRQENESAR